MTLSACDRVAPSEPHRLSPTFASSNLGQSTRHIVVFAAERIPEEFADHVDRLGGSIETSLASIGVAIVNGLSETAASELRIVEGIRAVEADVEAVSNDAQTADDTDATPVVSEAAADVSAVSIEQSAPSPTSAQFYARQWNMRAVFAEDAWAAGQLGSRDVKVAILDSGIDYLNPDLVGLVDLQHSISLVPEDVTRHYPGRLPFSDLHGHGTFVTSIVATNGNVLAGLNRSVTLLAVKITDSTTASSDSRFLSGIVYAADQGADVINISHLRRIDKNERPGVVAAFERAVNYAFRKGALVITVAGNDAADLDHDGNLVRMPCDAANAICVSATGPTRSAGQTGPWENVDAPASYTAFGRSTVSVAAPGGDGMAGQFRGLTMLCTTTPTLGSRPECRTGQRVAGSRGTSFAAPHVTGLGALLVAKLGHGNPGLIRARILQTADDLGEPGTDPYYGKGRINVSRALGLEK
jgi:subtilisin family serine protease